MRGDGQTFIGEEEEEGGGTKVRHTSTPLPNPRWSRGFAHAKYRVGNGQTP